MLRRQRTGSVICTSCGALVGVNDEKCYSCGRRSPGLWGFAPMLRALGNDLGFVPFVIGACVVVYVLTLLASGGGIGTGGLFTMFSPSTNALVLFGASGGVPFYTLGRWWTIFSASWLHAGILHILLNMMALRQLGPAVADMYGPGRMVIIYVLAGGGGFLLSSLAALFLPALPFLRGSALTVGASASIAGLLGAILYYGHRSGSSMARAYATQSAIMLLIMGFFFPGIDNYAHLGGFGAGYGVARVLDPLKQERGDHVAIALALLGISLGSVVWSYIAGI